jgi:hypothetical protein
MGTVRVCGCRHRPALVHLYLMSSARYFYWQYFFDPAKPAEGMGTR